MNVAVKVMGVFTTRGDGLFAVRPVAVGGREAKVAVTLRACGMVTVQVPVPLQPTLQPVKAEPAVGVAVRVTLVPKRWNSRPRDRAPHRR